MKILLCFLGVILLKTCKAPDVQSFFTLTNNANYMISYYVEELNRDTLIAQSKPYLRTIQPTASHKESDWGTWEERFSKIEKLSVFIFHTDTLNKYTWEEVRDGYMVLKRYDLSLDDLKRSNFTIIYP